MFYSASKILYALVQPSNVAVAMIGLGLLATALWPASPIGRRGALLGFILLLIFGLSPLSSLLTLPLEQRFTRPDLTSEGASIKGIIFLGGFESGSVSAATGQLEVNEAAERLIESAVLAKRLPHALVVFSGGARPGSVDAGDAVAAYLASTGIAKSRIVIENRSRTTAENAHLTRELLNPQAEERWLLVTSAMHMPRAIGAFRHEGFQTLPWPVDHRVSGPADLMRFHSRLGDGLNRTDDVVKEWIGLLVYRLTGRSDALFP